MKTDSKEEVTARLSYEFLTATQDKQKRLRKECKLGNHLWDRNQVCVRCGIPMELYLIKIS